ncbi:uncharacterized protein LOC144904957 isoform X29 [Branchiostoma floridae x Branchiostoma belcheri]
MEARIDRVKGALAAAHQRWQREVPLLSDKWLIVPAALILALVCFLVVTLKWIWVDHIFDSVEPTYGHGAVEMAAKGDDPPGMEGPSATVSPDTEGSGDDRDQDGRNQGGGVATNIIPDVILPSVPPLIAPETTPPSEQDTTTNPDITQTPSHGIPCKGKDTDYCLNGGKCTQLPAFGGDKPEKRCTCTDDYVGKRCQYLNPAVYRAQLRRKRSLAFRGAEEIHQKRVLAITGICLALLVVGIMCGVAWYMSRKQRKKWCRKHLMANGQAQGGDADGELHEGEIMIPMANLAGGSRTEPKQDLSDETTFRNGDSHAPHDNPNGDVGRSQPMDDFQGGRRMRLNGVAKPALSKPSWQSTPNKDRSPRKEFAALPAEPSPIPEPSTPPRPSLERPLPIPDLQQFRQASRDSSKEDLVNENTPLRKASSASSSGSSLQLDTSRPDRKPGLRDPGDIDLSTEEFHPYDVTDAGDLTPEFTPTNTPRIQRDRDYSNNNPPYISTSRPSDEEDENDNFNATDPDFHARLRNVIENQEAVAV